MINQWSRALFSAATGASGKKPQADALMLMQEQCTGLAMVAMPPSDKKSASAAHRATDKASTQKDLRYLQIHKHVKTSELLFDTNRTNDENVVGALFIYDSVASKPLSLKEICFALGGYCTDPRNQIKTKPQPAIEVEMPRAKGYPRQLLMPVIRVDKKTFYEKIRQSGAN